MDKEYAISFMDRGVLDEINSGAATLSEAKKVAKRYKRAGATQITIKHYENGDLRHQYDLVGQSWKQYE